MCHRKMHEIKGLLLLIVILGICNGHSEYIAPSNMLQERVKFEDFECMYPNSTGPGMKNLSVTICINPCAVDYVSIRGDYFVDGLKKYISLNYSIPMSQREHLFSVNITFNQNGNEVSLQLNSTEIPQSTFELVNSGSPASFNGWFINNGKKSLPFRVIKNDNECESEDAIETTTQVKEVTTLSIASTDDTQSSEGRQGVLEDLLAENKLAFVTGGGVVVLTIVILIIVAVCCSRRKRSTSKPKVEDEKEDFAGAAGGGISRRYSINSIYDSSSFSKPLERHESINSLYGNHDDFTAQQNSATKLNQLLKPPHQDCDGSNIYEPV